MSEVLILVEQVDGDVKKVTFELLTAARRIGEPMRKGKARIDSLGHFARM